MHIFGFDVHLIAVQQLVDALLNAVPGSPVRYTCFLNMAMVSFMDINKCTTPTEVIGWVPGRECAVWIPLLETANSNPLETRVVLWSPYIFINYAIGMATGREVWGWPKALSTITMPSGGATSPSFVLSTMLFEPFGVNTQGSERPLLAVTGTTPISTNSLWSDVRLALRNIIAALSNVPVAAVPDPLGVHPVVQTVALKQFRDSLMPNLACFQAIVNSPIRVTSFNGAGLHSGTFSLSITTCDSHQIVRDLEGVPPSPGSTILPVRFAAWMAFDFDALPGSVVARSI
jgi:hypothetical protein